MNDQSREREVRERQIREQQIRARRLARKRERRARARRARLLALGALLVVVLAAGAIALAASGGGKSRAAGTRTVASKSGHQIATRTTGHTRHGAVSASGVPHSTVTGAAAGKRGSATV